MKKLVLLFILFFSFFGKAQALYPGNIMLDGFLGYPNFGKGYIVSNLSNYTTTKFNGLAPSGIRGEYLIDDNIGVGFDFMYNYADLTYKEIDTLWQNDQMIINYNSVESLMKRYRLQFRFNYHFDSNNPRFDSYFGIGLGYNNRTFQSNRNGIDNTQEFRERVQILPFPISMRVCYGGRFYFSQNVGIVGEIGLGGPLFSVGLALKY
jgi:hypothetical protein